jgi:hypothetical protein
MTRRSFLAASAAPAFAQASSRTLRVPSASIFPIRPFIFRSKLPHATHVSSKAESSQARLEESLKSTGGDPRRAGRWKDSYSLAL